MRLGVFIAKCQCPDGADFDAFRALATGGLANRVVLEGRDPSSKAPSGKANGSDPQLLLAYPHTFATKDTLIGIVGKERTALVDGKVSVELSESFRYEFYAKMFSDFLKFTGSVFQTMTAVHRMT